MAWADSLNIGGVDDWRLPGGQMAVGGNETASEMGTMFYTVLDGTFNSSITVVNNATNYNFFRNVQPGGYWSGVEFGSPNASINAWYFNFIDGFQITGPEVTPLFAWAVRSGDVPAPGTLALLGAGLLGWAGVKRSRHRAGAVIG